MKKYMFLLVTTLGLALSSCADYLNINDDPSFPQVSDGNALMPPLIANMVRGEVFDTRFVGRYTQHFGTSGIGDT